MPAKPGTKPSWLATTFGTAVPSSQKKTDGWFPGEYPPNTFFNWFWKLVSEWIDYLDTIGESAHTWTGQQTFARAVENLANAILARLIFTISTATSRTLLAHGTLASGAGVRLYALQSLDSLGVLVSTLEVTINASWDGTQWVRDVAADASWLRYVAGNGNGGTTAPKLELFAKVSAPATWSSWDATGFSLDTTNGLFNARGVTRYTCNAWLSDFTGTTAKLMHLFGHANQAGPAAFAVNSISGAILRPRAGRVAAIVFQSQLSPTAQGAGAFYASVKKNSTTLIRQVAISGTNTTGKFIAPGLGATEYAVDDVLSVEVHADTSAASTDFTLQLELVEY
jgi:hypothetical protein